MGYLDLEYSQRPAHHARWKKMGRALSPRDSLPVAYTPASRFRCNARQIPRSSSITRLDKAIVCHRSSSAALGSNQNQRRRRERRTRGSRWRYFINMDNDTLFEQIAEPLSEALRFTADCAASKQNHIFDVTPASFSSMVLQSSGKGPVPVCYWSPNAGPCMMLLPRPVKLANDYPGRLLLCLLDSDQHKASSKDRGVIYQHPNGAGLSWRGGRGNHLWRLLGKVFPGCC